MLRLSNGKRFQHVTASGALGWKGRGWEWEQPLVWCGFIKPKLFLNITKSLSRNPIKGNLSWLHPWTCVKLIDGGVVNAVGLTNKGFSWWMEHVAPYITEDMNICVSLYGEHEDILWMVDQLEQSGVPIVGIEINRSCPNTGHDIAGENVADSIILTVKQAKKLTRHPLLVKLSCVQQYLKIALALYGIAEAINLNSVPWKIAFPGKVSPLAKLGGGGVSVRPAQKHNWKAVEEIGGLSEAVPVVGPSIADYEDLYELERLKAIAFAFGGIHVRTPWLPTQYAERWNREHPEPEE